MTRLALSPFQLLAACAYGAWLALATPSGDTVLWSLLAVFPTAMTAFMVEVWSNPCHPRINPVPMLLTHLAAAAVLLAPANAERVVSIAAGGLLTLATGGVVLAFLLGLVLDALEDLLAARPRRARS